MGLKNQESCQAVNGSKDQGVQKSRDEAYESTLIERYF